jgi:hypothetical protein
MAPVVPHLGHFLFLKLTKASAYTTAAISMHSNNASTSTFVRMLIAGVLPQHSTHDFSVHDLVELMLVGPR